MLHLRELVKSVSYWVYHKSVTYMY